MSILAFSIQATSVGRILLENAVDLGAAMVVASLTSKGGLRELIMGSTTSYLCHHSTVSVVVVR